MVKLWVYRVESGVLGDTILDVPHWYREEVAEILGIDLNEVEEEV